MAQSVIAEAAGEPLSWLARRRRRFEPVMLLWVALILVLLFLVVNPVLRLLVSSFEATDSGKLTLANYVIAYGHLRGWSALLNSLLYGVAVTIVAIILAVPIAWAVARTDMPGKGFVRAIILGAFITPSYLGAIGWILLAGPNAGWLNRIWMTVTGSSTGFSNIYSFGGLVLITCFLFWLQRRILGRKGYIALTGKGGGRRLAPTGPFRFVLLAYALLVCSLAVFLPFAALGQAAFSKAWGRGFSLDNLTLGNFHYLLFEQYNAQQTILHSFTYSAATACIAIVLALGIAYIVSRRLVPFGQALTFLCMAPFVVPGIVLAIGFYAAYAPPPLSLNGTAVILILAFTTRFLPIAYVNCMGGLRAINPEMEEAVRILGGGRLRAVTRVVVPLLKKSLAGSWILVFIPATRELSTAIFLVGAKTRVISVMLLDLSETGNFETLAALGFFLLGATILIVLAGYKLVGRDFLLRRN